MLQCGNKLQRTMNGPVHTVFAHTLRGLSAAKITRAKTETYTNHAGAFLCSALHCGCCCCTLGFTHRLRAAYDLGVHMLLTRVNTHRPVCSCTSMMAALCLCTAAGDCGHN